MTLRVSIVSDSTGETAESMLHAALAQFDGLDVTIERHRSVREALKSTRSPAIFISAAAT